MDSFVVDAGPFIHLEQINQLKLLKKLPRLFVPTSVVLEIRQGVTKFQIRTINHWPNIRIISVRKKPISAISAVVQKASLQPAEIDCIYLAHQMHPCILLTDDLTARTTAEKLSIEVHGTVGIIAYSFRRKWLSLRKAEEALNLLYHRSSLFITYGIIESAIRSLKNSI